MRLDLILLRCWGLVLISTIGPGGTDATPTPQFNGFLCNEFPFHESISIQVRGFMRSVYHLIVDFSGYLVSLIVNMNLL